MAGSSRSEGPSGRARRPAPSAISDERKRRRSRSIAIAGVLLGGLVIALSLYLGTPSGAALLLGLGLGDALVGFLVLLVVLVVLLSLLMGWGDRVVAKIGLRNVVRARTRTVILLVGLLVGSTIISSSLVIGDTVDNLTVHFTYIADGAVDEAIWAPVASTPLTGAWLPYQPFPTSLFAAFNASASSIPNVAGTSPLMIGIAGAFDRTTDIAQPGLQLIGADGASSAALGSFTSTNGTSVAGPRPGWVLLNPTAAQELSAAPGDRVTLTGVAQVPMYLHVMGIVKADSRGGFQDAGQGDVFTSLSDAQNLSGTWGMVDYVAVTNSGGLEGGPAHTHAVWPQLNASLAQAIRATGVAPAGLAVHSVLQSDVLDAQQSAQSLTQLFLVLGLFSIAAGCVLIVGIFAMLAEERRGEMGVARAVGMRRSQLVRAYYFEGLAYSAGSALLGTLLGVAVGWGIVQGFAALFGSGGGTAVQAVADSFTFTFRSLVLAYTSGFLLTLTTVSITSAYVSRMNIVRAIRSQPEDVRADRSRRLLLLLGVLMALVGALLTWLGRAPGTDIDEGYLGVSLLLFSVGLLLAYRLAPRWAFSLSAVALLVFWVDLGLRQDLFPGDHTGSIFVFFQEGVFLILAAVLLYVFNSDVIVRVLSRLARRGSRNLPVVRLAFAYPSQRRFRSAMTISIFAMVLFTITAIAVIGSGISAGVANTVRTQSGGYGFFATSLASVPDMAGEVANNSTLRGEISTVVPFFTGQAVVNGSGGGRDAFGYSVAAAPSGPGVPSWEDFYTSNRFNFSATFHGMSAAEVWQELQVPNATVAVVDGSFLPNVISAFQGGGGHPGAAPGDNLTLTTFSGASVRLTVVGIMAETSIPIILVNPALMTGGLGFTEHHFFLLSAATNADATKVVQDLQTHFFNAGLEVYNFGSLLRDALQFTNAFINLLEVFVALGLLVGITALGILALRAVTERRTHIGMVRAIGFRRSQVLTAFLTEYSFLALMGIGIGAVMGVVLAYNLYQAIGGFFSFAIPWSNLTEVLVVSYALTLVATGVPSFRASRTPPAEAIRYSE